MIVKERQQVLKEFDREGLSVAEWARRNGFADCPNLVYAILSGRTVGRRGRSHEIAVKLRLKATR